MMNSFLIISKAEKQKTKNKERLITFACLLALDYLMCSLCGQAIIKD